MLSETVEKYLADSFADIKQLIIELCAIPAPSNHEEKRAEYCAKLFRDWGAEPFIDEALNVICEYNVSSNDPVTVFMAHTDTVFPDTEPLPFTEDEENMYCPGVTDDTANLAVLLICARYILQTRPATRCGLVFVANSGEEGLGNLKGSRAVAKRYGKRMQELITLDGAALDEIANQAVGSHRYHITVETEGGHSFADFGQRNAIRYLAAIIDTLYQVEVPEKKGSRTTYNVGIIQGGTSVNTIAQRAEMLYEYRSDDLSCLLWMKNMYERVIETYRAMGLSISSELVGDRPCAENVDPHKLRDLVERASESIRFVVGKEPSLHSASTDCNIPLSLGIPAICLGACRGGGRHTREEWLEKASLRDGSRLFMDFLLQYTVQ